MAATPAVSGTASNSGPLLEGTEAPAGRDRRCSPSGLHAALDSYGWVVHLGPLSVGRDGVDVRPQLKFGGQVGNFAAEVGVGDVRDGLRFESGVRAFAEAEGSGHSLEELHADVRRRLSENAAATGSSIRAVMNSSRVEEALEAASRILSSSARGLGSRTDEIARTLGVDVADLDRALQGDTAGVAPPAGYREAASGSEAVQGTERPPMTLKLRASTGLGVSCQVSLGWCDTSGYHMVGLGMKAVALIATGGNLFVGRHRAGVGLKIVLGISNFTLEYTFPRARVPERASRGDPAAERRSPLPAGAVAAGAVGNGAEEGGLGPRPGQASKGDASAEPQRPQPGGEGAASAGAGAEEGEGPRSGQAPKCDPAAEPQGLQPGGADDVAGTEEGDGPWVPI